MEYHLPVGYVTADTFSDDERGQIAQAWSEMLEGYKAYKGTMPFAEYAQAYLHKRNPRWNYHENINPLQATSNVIELKPGHKYLLVFKSHTISQNAVEFFNGRLREMGIQCVSMMLNKEQSVEVIEVPAEQQKAGDE